MSTTNSLSSHLEDLRNPQSPPGDSSYSGYNTPSRYSASFMTTHSQSNSTDTRSSLHRRFTADSGKVPTVTPAMAPIGPPASQVLETVDTNPATLFKLQAIERKRIEYEKLREQRLQFEIELENFKIQQAMEKKELEQMTQDLRGINIASGHQSEPTTPPEYRDHNFPSIYSRRNRYSASNLMSPPGLGNSRNRGSGSQLQSPPADARQAQGDPNGTDKLPSKSVPGSRRGSNDRITPYASENAAIGQRSTAKNRYSMPVTSSMARKRESVPEYSEAMGNFHINTTGFLFGDDDDKPSAHTESATSPDVNTYLQMNTTDDKFPILIRNNQRVSGFPTRERNPANGQPQLSASSAALDLALTQTPAIDSQTNGWTAFGRHRPSQPSLPQNQLDATKINRLSTDSLNGGSQLSIDESLESPLTARQVNRHSMEATFAAYGQQNHSGQSNKAPIERPSLANLQSSYSTNDIFTIKKAVSVVSPISPPKTKAENKFHNHNASLGRIPTLAANPRSSRDLQKTDGIQEDQPIPQKTNASELHASAPPFGPSATASFTAEQVAPGYGTMPAYTNPAYYGGYGMQQVMSMGMTPLAMNGPAAFGNQLAAFQNQLTYPAYQQNHSRHPRIPDSQARVIRERRLQNQEELARFHNMKLDAFQGQIYNLCKDQYGCRYLQKQMDSRDPAKIHTIFLETNQHVIELMTDPFGNYLCQKLFELSNDEERTVLINNASSSMLEIALNQHGTRALQKLIECLSTPEQIRTVIFALKDCVVRMIKDLNGNHVIQKCLNHLAPEDAQFIFDSVGTNCIAVGTHRHGCCVLQRCIDHASGSQRAHLIAQITENAYSLVQDPFGNYVLQYIVDLHEPIFTTPLCMALKPDILVLSKQKFSSNVIEKCLRGALPDVASQMIDGMLNAKDLEKLVRDPFANYVVQTALEHSAPATRSRLVEAILPILPSVRTTPYGRRIQSKIMGTESNGRLTSNSVTSNDVYIPNSGAGRHNSMSSVHGQFSQQPKDYQLPNGQYSNTAHNGHRANGSFSSHTSSYSNGTPNFLGRGVGRASRFSDTRPFNSTNPAANYPSVHQHQELVPPYESGPMNNSSNYF